ncbi:ankyrin repeat-containing domain protein [Ilyonectria robusta]|uniref:ankyrin repeat-containing domain protein n=1 Tax=Ilyonectria robusta TaxID=1079257 RepID=UPI001E8E9605|nr:ankyrin repeat-containing domain protein [Ilyonectria robusta]KAH8662646.1 ankyrin repeat-containing domain protein [Ilyonectria robusta]
MSRAPRIPAPEWDRHKDHIHDVYVVQGKTLEELISFMAKDHGFEPTKAQYVRKLDGWNMRKNFKKEEWEHADALVRKRKAAGKDTELVISGRVIEGKKRRKALNRYAVLPTFFQAASTKFETGHDEVTARTPPSTGGDPFIMYNNLPWFQFQDHVTKLAISSMPSGILIPTSVELATSLTKNVFGISVEQDMGDTRALSDLSCLLEEKVPKRRGDNFNCHIERLSQPQPLLQVLQWAVFLSSNGLLPNEETDALLRWVTAGGHSLAMEQILRVGGPTTLIFASNLLLSAIRIGNETFVEMLLDQGISPNSADSTFTARTALQTAVISANSGIVQLLLDRGADVNGTIPGPLEYIPPLNLFLAHKNRPLQILKILIKAGADVNHIKAGYLSALQAAVSHVDPDAVTVLLEAGADVNMPLGEKYKVICTQTWEKYTVPGNKISLPTLCTPLSLAASCGNKEIARLLLEADADIDGLWFSEATVYENLHMFGSVEATNAYLGTETPLQLSVRFGHLAMIRFLLDAGANPNAVSISGSTALQSIFAGGVRKPMLQKVAHLLLSRGATVNIPASRNLAGMTPIQEAARWGDIGSVGLFVDNGADLNVAPYHLGGRTALQAAAESGNVDLVTLLIKSGGAINADAAAYNGLTCLQAAASSGNLALVNILLQLGADVNAPASLGSGLTSLQAAVKRGDVGMVERLLDAGADVNQIINGQTALCSAIGNCHYDGYSNDTYSNVNNESIYNLLMENGANPDPINVETTPLAIAASNGQFHLVGRLLDAGADVNRPSLNPLRIPNMAPGLTPPQTPLAIAVAHRHEDVVNLLINSGAGLNHVAHVDGANPLHYAFNNDKFSRGITESLIRSSADPNKPSATGVFPIHLAAKCLSSEDAEAAIKILIDAEADVHSQSWATTALQISVKRGHERVVKMLLDAGADVNTQSRVATALQRAVEKGHKSLVEMLLDAGADINAPAAPSWGTTALQAAAKRNDLHLVRDLISRGADVNAPPAIEIGATALQLAAIHGNINMAILLLENGADVNAEPAAKEGRTSLQGAAERGRLDMVYLLLENDKEMESIEERCQEAARFADSNHHPILAKVLREWKRP